MTKLCCIFNYAPLYRKSIYMKIDEEFDTQFYFSDMKSDIPKIDYSDFKKMPITIRDKVIARRVLWRRDILWLPLKNFTHFLIIGDTSLSYIPFILLCKLLGKKIYAWGHGVKSLGRKTKYYNKWFYKICDAFLLYGERGRSRLIELGIPERKLHVIYNSLNAGVDPNDQFAYKSNIFKEYFLNELPVIMFVGRLTKEKKIDWIIKAHASHLAQGLMYNVLIIGAGEEERNLREIVKKYNSSKMVWFYGECYDEEKLSSLLYNSDLCVSPGNVGLTALHALSYGTPVISHNDFETQMPEYEVIVPRKTGDLYEKDNFDDFCLKINQWLSMEHNRSQIRQNCYEIINDKWNSNYQINLLKEIINQ